MFLGVHYFYLIANDESRELNGYLPVEEIIAF